MSQKRGVSNLPSSKTLAGRRENLGPPILSIGEYKVSNRMLTMAKELGVSLKCKIDEFNRVCVYFADSEDKVVYLDNKSFYEAYSNLNKSKKKVEEEKFDSTSILMNRLQRKIFVSKEKTLRSVSELLDAAPSLKKKVLSTAPTLKSKEEFNKFLEGLLVDKEVLELNLGSTILSALYMSNTQYRNSNLGFVPSSFRDEREDINNKED